MKLPKRLYVRIERRFFVASSDVEIEGDGPDEVGVYELVEKRIVRKLLDQTTKR